MPPGLAGEKISNGPDQQCPGGRQQNKQKPSSGVETARFPVCGVAIAEMMGKVDQFGETHRRDPGQNTDDTRHDNEKSLIPKTQTLKQANGFEAQFLAPASMVMVFSYFEDSRGK
jgi:hypothetical protein